MTRVRVQDLRTAFIEPGQPVSFGYICPDIKAWFERNDLDFADFVWHGIDADELRAIDDGADDIARAIAAAEAREAAEQEGSA